MDNTAVTPEGITISLVCPHAGCIVQEKDQKWICGCHGSEFDLEGRLLKGPAKTDLKAVA